MTTCTQSLSLVPAVAEAALVGFILGRVTLKVGARQVVEQHVKTRVEEVFPSRLEVSEERGFVSQELVVTDVKLVGLDQREVPPEQISQGAALKPLAVQAPFTPRIDEPVEAEGLEDQIPARAFAAGGQRPSKEGVEAELFVELATQPAGAPLPRVAQFQLRKLDAPHRCLAASALGAALIGFKSVVAQKRDGFGSHQAVLEDLNALLPRLLLAVTDFTEVEHMALEHLAPGHAPVFHDAPIAVQLAVFRPRFAAQEHDDR